MTSTPIPAEHSPTRRGPGVEDGVETSGGEVDHDLRGVVGMRRYDEPVEVRKGLVAGTHGPVEGPEQFLWKGRLWKVCDVVAHWVETGPWWQSRGVAPVLGDDTGEEAVSVHDLLAEREVWRVEAARGLAATGAGRGVFDLAFDWGEGSWQLARSVD
jgi:hypothetical protein